MPDPASFFSCSFIRPFSLVVSSFFLFRLPIRFLVVLCVCLLPSSAASPSSSPAAFKLLCLCTCLFSSHSILPVALFPGVNWQGPEVGSFLHLASSLKEWVELCLHSTSAACTDKTLRVASFVPPPPLILPPFPSSLLVFYSFCTFLVFLCHCSTTAKWQHDAKSCQLQHIVQSVLFLDSTTLMP